MSDPSAHIKFAHDLTESDRIILDTLCHEYKSSADVVGGTIPKSDSGVSLPNEVDESSSNGLVQRKEVKNDSNVSEVEAKAIQTLKSYNDPKSSQFRPTVFVSLDVHSANIHPVIRRYLLDPYVRWASSIVRAPTDVVFVTHLLLYFSTSVPSAIYLYTSFHWWHGILHLAMQGYYIGSYTLMMHQHIHQRGILSKKYWLFDTLFPYLTDPLLGHTWNTYFYHHVKHHHVEGNGPDDLSSTLRYQRDDIWHFAHYVGRFYFLIWFDLPLYFLRKGKYTLAAKSAFFEYANYTMIYLMATRVHLAATIWVLILPLAIMRLGLMIGNWGQHAFVDEVDPTSDFRSSITLIDVPSNRYCFNDGYHTSHHLNPLRHWRDHPGAFLSQKEQYAREHALTFHDVDYLFITYRLMRKDYASLARCLVPMGEQVGMTMVEREEMLRTKVRRFSEEEIRRFWPKAE